MTLTGLMGALALTLSVAGARAELVDDQGRTVALPGPPQRIVSLSPGNTELLFALNAADRLVGVTGFCDYPEAARQIDRVAEFSTVSLESIIAARPDLVVAARGNPRDPLETLRRMGIPVFALDIQDIDQLLEAIQRLGRLIDAPEEAAALRTALEQRVKAVRARSEALAWRPRVMWGHWSEPIYTAGANTIIDAVFTAAGGINVGRQAPGAWPQVSLETLVDWAPDVIVTTVHPGAANPPDMTAVVARLQQTDGWKTVPAVRHGHVVYIDADLLNRPGPRLIDSLEEMSAVLQRVTAGVE